MKHAHINEKASEQSYMQKTINCALFTLHKGVTIYAIWWKKMNWLTVWLAGFKSVIKAAEVSFD